MLKRGCLSRWPRFFFCLDPDYTAYSGGRESNIKGIRAAEDYVFSLWKFLQADLIYESTATLFVTNDHGRHLTGVGDGFAGHGDD